MGFSFLSPEEKNQDPKDLSKDLNFDISVGPAEMADALKEKYPWMNTFQAVEATNLINQQLADHIKNGGLPGSFYPATPDSPAKFVFLWTTPNDQEKGDQ